MKNSIRTIIFGFALMNFSAFLFLMSNWGILFYIFIFSFALVILGLIINIKDND